MCAKYTACNGNYYKYADTISFEQVDEDSKIKKILTAIKRIFKFK